MSELAKRVRAARCYAGLTQRELGEALGHPDDQNIKRSEGGRRDPGKPEQYLIAAVCGLPPCWFFVDFARLPELDDRASQLAAVEQEAGELPDLRPPRNGRRPGESDDGPPRKKDG